MRYIIGKIFFPMSLHSEKRLLARMRMLTMVCGLILVISVAGVMWRLNKSRGRAGAKDKPVKAQSVQPAR